MDDKKYLSGKINKCRRRINLALVLDKGIVCLAISAVAAILLEVYSLIRPFYYVNYFVIFCVILGALFAVIFSIISRCDMKKAALAIDRFGLKERVVTAFEQLKKDDDISILQRKDAAEKLREKEKDIRIPLRPPARHIFAFFLAYLCLIVIALFPSSVREQATALHEVSKQAEEEKEKLDELIDAMENIDMDALSEEQKNELQELLESLKLSQEELASVKSEEDFSAAKEKLSYKYNETASGLNGLSGKLSEGAENALANAETLAKAAASDSSRLASAGGNKSGASTGNGNSSGENKDGNGAGSVTGTEGGDGGAGSTESGGDGSENSTGSTNGSSGKGSGTGNGTKTNGNGTDGDGGGGGNGNGRGTGSGSSTHDYVSVPNELGDDSAISGQQNGSDNTDAYRAKNGLAWEGEHVSLDSVIGNYTKDAYDGISSGKYPSGMEDVIKDYFENLNN
jgi:hypothetical protein